MENNSFKVEKNPEEPPREAPPSNASIGTPFGLDKLRALSRVDISQRTITTEHGDVIFELKREPVQRGSSTNLFHDLYDKTGRMVIQMKPNARYTFSTPLEVYIDGQHVANLLKTNCFFSSTPKYLVSDVNGEQVLRIYLPDSCQVQFLIRLKDLQGNRIGSITKEWHGPEREKSDFYELQIDFPRELGVQYKAAVIGFCFVLIYDVSRDALTL